MKIDLRTIPDAEVSGIDLMDVDITLPAPEAEPQRQYYFMALLKQQLVPERAKKNGKEFRKAGGNSGNRRLPHCGNRGC